MIAAIPTVMTVYAAIHRIFIMNSPEPAGRVIGVIGAAADAVLAGLGLGVLLRVISRRCDDCSPHFLGFISVVGSPTSEVAVSFFIPHLHLRRYMALNFRVWPAACPRCALVDVVGRIPANSALLELVRVQRGLDNGEVIAGVAGPTRVALRANWR
jgi:hypothetical protein